MYGDQRQLDEALALYLEILPYIEREGGVTLGSIYNNMAIMYRNQGKRIGFGLFCEGLGYLFCDVWGKAFQYWTNIQQYGGCV